MPTVQNQRYKFGNSAPQRQDKGSQTPAAENVERMRRLHGTQGKSTMDRIRTFAQSEQERQRKQKEEAAKKKAAPPKSTAPEKGFFQKMYDKYVSGKSDK